MSDSAPEEEKRGAGENNDTGTVRVSVWACVGLLCMWCAVVRRCMWCSCCGSRVLGTCCVVPAVSVVFVCLCMLDFNPVPSTGMDLAEAARRGLATAQQGVATAQAGIDTAQGGVDTAQDGVEAANQVVVFHTARSIDTKLSGEEREKAKAELKEAKAELKEANGELSDTAVHASGKCPLDL